jgi:anti-sigma-K factor RskA
MEDELIHELSAAYALNALDRDEERAFEAHLATCSLCQESVAAFSTTTASLGYAAPAAAPPPELRARLLDAARAERSNVVTLRSRRSATVVAAVATAAAVAFAVLWVAAPREHPAQALHSLPLKGAKGSLVVAAGGEATLVVSGLAAAPANKTYEAWIVENEHASPAGLFAVRNGTGVLRLARRVPRGATVAVTLERAGGALAPTGALLVTSGRA